MHRRRELLRRRNQPGLVARVGNRLTLLGVRQRDAQWLLVQTARDAPLEGFDIVIRHQADAGHHRGSLSGNIEERGDILAFLAKYLGAEGCS